MSDVLKTKDVVLQMELMNFKGKVLRRHQVEGKLPINSSVVFYEEDWNQAFAACDTTTSFIHMTLKDRHGREILSDEVYYPALPKSQHLPQAKISCKMKKKNGAYELTLKSDQLARDVFIEIPVQGVRFSDNFFDLLPGVSRKILVTSGDGCALEDLTVNIRQLGDICSIEHE